jgi:lipopolysaccharide/colanic/teichoic acid biosynthesis glycosyltransferase
MSTSCVECNASVTPSVDCDHNQAVRRSVRVSRYFGYKGWLDRGLAAAMLLPGLPLIGLLVALIRLTSKGPGVYQQVRVGRGGKNYTMFKLRSMRVDAERGTGAVWAKQGDGRITPLGYWLRKLHLDELPQLFNVLRGEMSLIGPRPERPEFVKILVDEIPGYADRLHVLPGVTGLAQINLPADRDLNDVRRKIVLDREYLETGSLMLDLRILACTLLRMFGLRGERAMWLLRLERKVEIELGSPQFSEVSTVSAVMNTEQLRENETTQSATAKVKSLTVSNLELASAGMESR